MQGPHYCGHQHWNVWRLIDLHSVIQRQDPWLHHLLPSLISQDLSLPCHPSEWGWCHLSGYWGKGVSPGRSHCRKLSRLKVRRRHKDRQSSEPGDQSAPTPSSGCAGTDTPGERQSEPLGLKQFKNPVFCVFLSGGISFLRHKRKCCINNKTLQVSEFFACSV